MSVDIDESFQQFCSWLRRRRLDLNGYPLADDQQWVPAAELKAKLRGLGLDAGSADAFLQGHDRILASGLLAATAAGWRPALAQHENAAKSSNRAKAACIDWLLAEMRLSPTERTKPKDEYWKIAKGKFPGLSERSFQAAWATAIKGAAAESWSKPGSRLKPAN
jgi:hypothetical protein